MDDIKKTKDPNVIKMGEDEYDVIPPQAVAASEAVVRMWIYLGRPQNPFTKQGKKLMNIMIAVWEDTYPVDSAKWYGMRKDYRDAEMSITDQIKNKTGRSLASYPFPLYQMMKKVFPGFDPGQRDNAIKFVKHWPMFQMANKI